MSANDFAATAARYCNLIERHGDCPLAEFLEHVRSLLPLLYHQAVQLSEIEASDDESALRDITYEEWFARFDSLRKHLGRADVYRMIFDPAKDEFEAPVCGSLADDLADIWRDLSNGAKDWPTASESLRQRIHWHWHFDFHSHWSRHAVNAMRAIDDHVERYL